MSSAKMARLKEWWRPKAGTILSLLLFYLSARNLPFNFAVQLLFSSVVTLCGFGLATYFLNDWADIPSDRKAGKTNAVADLLPWTRLPIFLVVIGFTMAPWFLFFRSDSFSKVLIALEFMLIFLYPLPPFRLKNHPRAAMLADSLYAFTVPTVLAWHTFDLMVLNRVVSNLQPHLVFLAVWMTMRGLRQIVNHHVQDRENDRVSGTPNLALRMEIYRIRGMVGRIIYPVEFVSSVGFFLSCWEFSGLFSIALACGVVILGIPLLPIKRTELWFDGIPTDRLTSYYLGVFSLLLLSAHDARYLIVLLVFLFLFSNLIKHPIWVPLKLWSFRTLSHPSNVLSLSANWLVYYFRKWFLNWSEERNWGVHYAKHLEDKAIEARKKRGTIAIFNQNLKKYTETFVQGHIGQLPYHVIQLYGWPSPMFLLQHGNLVSDNRYLRSLIYNWWETLALDARIGEDRLLCRNLVDKEVCLMVAEFGTMGARLTNVSRLTGIPMIVIFYGYDAWHSKELLQNEAEYQEMFRQASAVVGVSRDICGQLQRLGCHSSKIFYLPCYVDLQLFSPVERDFSRKVILTVGRFCVTKAPNLTILAFNDVLKRHPNAELRMVGLDEGNGIMESCRSLVKALGIETQVEFLGSLDHESIAQEMRSASLFVQHSVTAPETGDREGTPVAIMEAMACGMPIVSTKHAGIEDMIQNGQTGILVNEFDYLRMAEEMTALFNHPEKMRELGDAAADSIRSNDLVREHIEILSRLIDLHKIKR
ncbi:MAG: glycosyltransferase [Flavobacteriales bacterium]|nr:glycosyltransferase [Flavobacteriales bacterium]